jgi:pimeloyl-ACP methyl ester carboxylesterase
MTVLAYTDEGGGPPLVFAHGMGSDRTRWWPITARLTDGFRCVAVDLPGHGGSSAEGCDSLSAAGAVFDTVRALGLGPPIVVGHSLGANVALLYGALYGARSVIAIDPAPLHLPHLADALAPYAEGLQGPDFATTFARWEHDFALAGVPAAQRAALAGGLQPRREVVLSYWQRLFSRPAAEELQPGFTAALASIEVPVLVCLATSPSKEDQAILAQMRTVTVEVYEGMSHFMHLVDPTRFARRIRDWSSR